jgi:NADPH:quinone reductase
VAPERAESIPEGQMQAIQLSEFGGPEVLRLAEVTDPVAGPGQVLVEVSAAGINYMDTFQRQGARGGNLPLIPGAEGGGVVVAFGEGVEGVAIGQRVGWKSAPGSYASKVAVDLNQLVPLPDAISEEVAAAVLLQGLTAQYLADSAFELSEGDVALVHSAAGGVGLLLTQIAAARGALVVGTVSSLDKAPAARQAGAAEVVTYEHALDAVARVSEGRGAEVVYDAVGQSTFETSLEALRPHGMLVLYGAASGPVPPFDLRRIMGSKAIRRPSLGDYTSTRADLLDRAERLFGWITEGSVEVAIGGRYPLGDAAQAHRDLEGRSTTGKLLLLTH